MKRTSFTISIDVPIYKRLEKRAKRELRSVPELAESILRRSVIKYKTPATDKVDDKFLTFFSRRRR